MKKITSEIKFLTQSSRSFWSYIEGSLCNSVFSFDSVFKNLKRNLIILSMLTGTFGFAQFAPPAGQSGTTAIYKDSSVFSAWATECAVTRGYQDISNTSLGYASSGDSTMALGKPGTGDFVSLGDGGSAIVTFANSIYNSIGWDFAVFENGFSDTFLELAFVEVSSDGINYFRFPATSNTQDTLQIGSFGSVDATQINNLAGKYKAMYGTPFDLQELSGQSGLDINNITHVKIIDVVGCLQDTYARQDYSGKKINDPWSTTFASGGFDLDAVGVIHQMPVGIKDTFSFNAQLSAFPNPIKNNLTISFYLNSFSDATISISDLTGKIIYKTNNNTQLPGMQLKTISNLNLNDGFYLLKIDTDSGFAVQKIIITNE